MKNVKLFLTAFAVVATVGSALAVKANFFGSGSVFCTKSMAGVCQNRVSFRNDPNGTSVNPCGTTAGVENPSFIWDQTNGCTQNNLGLTYSTTAVGK